MTDENTKTPDDPRQAALIRAGCRQESLADAAKLFRPGGNRATGVWHMGDHTGSADELAQAWIDEHPWFRGAQQDTPGQPDVPRYADGTPVSGHDVSADEWFAISARADADKAAAARGPQPEPESPESIAARSAAARQELARDAAEVHRAEQDKGGAKVGYGSMLEPVLPGVSPEFRSHYSSEPSADDLFAAAGPDPNPWQP